MSSSRFLVLASLLAASASFACGDSTSTTDGGSDAAVAKDTGTKKDANLPDTSTPDDDGGTQTGPTIDPQCTVPALASGGSCSPALDDAGINCNILTNAGCAADAGEACDFDDNGGLTCFPPPPPNTQTICQNCDLANGPECAPGLHCVDTTNGGQCAQVCCTDADCTPGHCDTTTLQSAPIGFCVK